jgi:hypothetical protein
VIPRIDRRALGPGAALGDEVSRRRRPVIVTNLLEGSPIREIGTLERAREALGETPITIRQNYDVSLFEECGAEPVLAPREMPLSAYLDLVAGHEDTTWMCIEQPLPQRLSALAPWPPELSRHSDDGLRMLFVGNRGNYARFHFDGDQREVLLYQVAGSKRVCIAPPQAGPKLVPLRNFSALCVDQFSPAERADLLRYVGGVECVLEAGEALYVPALHWHYVDYLTTGLSIAFRLGRDEHARMLSRLHPTHRAQAVSAAVLDANPTDPTVRRELEAVRAALDAAYTSPVEMYDALELVIEGAYARLCPDWFQGTYCVSGLEDMERLLGIAHHATEAADKFKGPAAAGLEVGA